MARPSLRARTGVAGIDLFKIAGHSIAGWVPSYKTGVPGQMRHPFCSTIEEHLLLYLEYHPQVACFGRGDISADFARLYRLTTVFPTPFAIGYLFDGQPHDYLPDFVGTLSDGALLLAEAGRTEDKQHARQCAKAEAARRLAHSQGGVYWLGTEDTLSRRRHHNLIFLHTRRADFPAYAEIHSQIEQVWPVGEPASVAHLSSRLDDTWTLHEREAALWKWAADATARGHLLVDLTQVLLDRHTELRRLAPDDPPILPDPLPETLPLDPSKPHVQVTPHPIPGPTFDAMCLPPATQARFAHNLAAVSAVLAGGAVTTVAQSYAMAHSTLSRLVARTRMLGQIACVPHGSYARAPALHPAFIPLVRRLYASPLKPSLTAIHEHPTLLDLARRLTQELGQAVVVPSYQQLWDLVQQLDQEPALVAARQGRRAVSPARQSPHSYVLSLPGPAQICQVDEHVLDVRVLTADQQVITQRVHAAVLICVKTAAILGAVLALGQMCEEDYMRLIKQALEPKDALVLHTNCRHPWPCTAKPAVIFHDRGKIFTSERARHVLVERLGIILEQAPPYCPSAKGTVEALFTWMTHRFEERLLVAAIPKEPGMPRASVTFAQLETLFIQSIVDDYMQSWDTLRRQTRITLWEEAAQRFGVARYLGAPDDLKLLLMKAVNRKNLISGRYTLHAGSRLSFLGRWYVSPGVLDRLRGKEFDIYYDRRDLSVIYLFLEGHHLGEAYCTQWMGRRVSIWEAHAERQHDQRQAHPATEQALQARDRMQRAAIPTRTPTQGHVAEQERQHDQQRPEIHPQHVLTTLAALQAAQRPTPTLALPAARSEPEEVPISLLPIRPDEVM